MRDRETTKRSQSRGRAAWELRGVHRHPSKTPVCGTGDSVRPREEEGPRLGRARHPCRGGIVSSPSPRPSEAVSLDVQETGSVHMGQVKVSCSGRRVLVSAQTAHVVGTGKRPREATGRGGRNVATGPRPPRVCGSPERQDGPASQALEGALPRGPSSDLWLRKHSTVLLVGPSFLLCFTPAAPGNSLSATAAGSQQVPSSRAAFPKWPAHGAVVPVQRTLP